VIVVFLSGAHLPQTLELDGKQGVFDFRRDQARVVQILEMGLVFCPKARKFHAHQVIERRQPQAVKCPSYAEAGRGLRVASFHFLAGENDMYGTAGGRLAGLNQHVSACDMTMLKAKRLHRLRNCGEIFTANRYIDIARQASGVRVAILHIQVCGEAPDYAIVQSSRGEGALNNSGQFKQLLHALLEECVYENLH